jgi:hypothetical protein
MEGHMEEYCGDMLLTQRLYKFNNRRYWNDRIITLKNIKEGIDRGVQEQLEPYGNEDMPFLEMKTKSDDWHIGRVIYFINHPEEIINIGVDNICNGMQITSIPIVTDGNHRLLAAMYLKLKKVHCLYGGRVDVLDYLMGKTKELPLM